MTAFPSQKAGEKERRYCMASCKNQGMAAPSIKREESFVIAMPSSLFEEQDMVSMADISPCSAPMAENSSISMNDKMLSIA